MGSSDPGRRLVVNADDFGRSHSINEAVIRAHREGILTTASLMVNGEAFSEAVELARQNPTLGVGLHISLVCGRSSLKPTEIPGLVDEKYRFTDDPVAAGMRYFFIPSLRHQLRHEIHAQFQKFRLTGLKLDHVNGHLNMHMHPVVFGVLRRHHSDLGVTHMRVTRDEFWLNARIAGGEWMYRVSHAIIFNLLSWRVRGALKRRNIRHTRRVFGLLQNGRVDERFVLQMLSQLPSGDSELYSHPSTDVFRNEFDALISPAVREFVKSQQIRLIRYQDL